MRIPTVEKCCCCMDLKNGVLALSALIGVLSICYFIHGIIIGSAWLIVLSIIATLASVCAIAGILKLVSFWPYLLLPLLLVGVIAIITLILLPFFIYDSFAMKHDENRNDPIVVFFVFLFLWTFAAITSYLWIIVYSLFDSMRKEAPGKNETA